MGVGCFVSDSRALPGPTLVKKSVRACTVETLLLFGQVDSQCFLAPAPLPSTTKGHSRQADVRDRYLDGRLCKPPELGENSSHFYNYCSEQPKIDNDS